MVAATKRKDEQGFALLAALIMLLLIAGVSIGLIYMTNGEVSLHTSDLENTQAYYGAEAAMEKMMVDISSLYATKASPTVAQITALGGTSNSPASIPNVSYSEYAFSPTVDSSGAASYTYGQISSGTYAGLYAQLLPITIAATAKQNNGAEVRMIRKVQVALIPVFQFGAFSDSDLYIAPGASMHFVGRVHANGNLFLGPLYSGGNLFFESKVSSAKQIIRSYLPSAYAISPAGFAMIATTVDNGCSSLYSSSSTATSNISTSACRNLATTEASWLNGIYETTFSGAATGSANSSWKTISTSTYNSRIVNKDTGGTTLSLPFVADGYRPIQIIRRPPSSEDSTSSMGQARLYNLAQIRVLLADKASDLPGGSSDSGNVNLENYSQAAGDFSSGITLYNGTTTYFAEADTTGTSYATTLGGSSTITNYSNWVPIASTSDAPFNKTYSSSKKWPLLAGWLRVEIRTSSGTYTPVTLEWLKHGFSRGISEPVYNVQAASGTQNSEHPDAIIILQQLADRNYDGSIAVGTKTSPGADCRYASAYDMYNWYPINFYDVREGEPVIDTSSSSSYAAADGYPKIGGIMNAVEIDVGNLRKWLKGTMSYDTDGTNVENSSQNGYILYFSDRRGQILDSANSATELYGNYGFEDVLNNTLCQTELSMSASELLNAEDVNDNDMVDTYGRNNLGDGFSSSAQSYSGGSPVYVSGYDDPNLTKSTTAVAWCNRVSGARHILRLVNAQLGNLPDVSSGTGGFTVASENPVYVYGTYNATSSGWTGSYSPAAASIIADAVTMLSNSWSDVNSFKYIKTLNSGRVPSESAIYYRVAIATGKNKTFGNAGKSFTKDWGNDGGLHNFFRFLEDWNGKTVHYMGSMVNLFYSEYATGIFKYYKPSSTPYGVYEAPTRDYNFDTNFTDPSKMPPGTPKFRDIENLGYQQDILPPD